MATPQFWNSQPKCLNCGEVLSDNVFYPNKVLSPDMLEVINEYRSEKVKERCNSCGGRLYEDCLTAIRNERLSIAKKLEESYMAIPILSLHAPQGWEYTCLDLVTAQSVTGTGFLSELTSSIDDFFGMQSNSHTGKIANGEELCKSILRRKANSLGANAILGADIDYAEVGGSKGMLMVCMTGTAVVLKSEEVFPEKLRILIKSRDELKARLNFLSRFQEQ
ncbi:MAG: heavy metal-binding domain-containing protein [Planctomycetes bacterium]|nr:heavy metal-binding domain-containing protein [Planctomycetota bacterium]